MSEPRSVEIQDWCRLCDILNTPPDTAVDHVLDKVETLQELLTRCREQRQYLLAACQAVVAAADYVARGPRADEHYEHHALAKRRRADALCRAIVEKAEGSKP